MTTKFRDRHHAHGPSEDIIPMPWLETEYGIDESDRAGSVGRRLRSVAEGDLTSPGDLQRRCAPVSTSGGRNSSSWPDTPRMLATTTRWKSARKR